MVILFCQEIWMMPVYYSSQNVCTSAILSCTWGSLIYNNWLWYNKNNQHRYQSPCFLLSGCSDCLFFISHSLWTGCTPSWHSRVSVSSCNLHHYFFAVYMTSVLISPFRPQERYVMVSRYTCLCVCWGEGISVLECNPHQIIRVFWTMRNTKS